MGRDLVERCDHPECPARAQRTVLIYGADFYFCTHHAEELAPLLVDVPSCAPAEQDEPEAVGAVAGDPSKADTGARSRRGWLGSR